MALKTKPDIGARVRFGKRVYIVTGSGMDGDRVTLVWIRPPEGGAELTLRGAELQKLHLEKGGGDGGAAG